jgi:hypothetical protein
LVPEVGAGKAKRRSKGEPVSEPAGHDPQLPNAAEPFRGSHITGFEPAHPGGLSPLERLALLHDWLDTKPVDEAALRSAAQSAAGLVGHDVPEVRRAAASTMLRLGRSAAAAIPHFIPLIRSPDAEVRRLAACCLAVAGPGAEVAIPALFEAWTPELREVPIVVVERPGAAAACGPVPSIPRLFDSFGHAFYRVVERFLVLRRKGPSEPDESELSAVSALVRLASYGGYHLRRSMRPPVRVVRDEDIDWLLTASLGEAQEGPQFALSVLCQVAGARPDVIELLMDVADSDADRMKRQMAVSYLAEMGPDADAATTLMLALIDAERSDDYLHSSACHALARIRPDMIREVLFAEMASDDPLCRRAALTAIVRSRADRNLIEEAFAIAEADPSELVRERAAWLRRPPTGRGGP